MDHTDGATAQLEVSMSIALPPETLKNSAAPTQNVTVHSYVTGYAVHGSLQSYAL